MQFKLTTLVLFQLLIVDSTYASEEYGICKVYGTDDNLPEIVDGHRECIKSEMSTFCIEWTCPDPECDNPTKPETGCPFCQGDCSYGGKIYKERESFQCVDNVNTCHCLAGGVIGSSLIAVNPEYMCTAKLDKLS
ncbi:uncharacterized protein LOC134706313 [Mytilus trossulus]|uniref:uncharacterized protein LOC134706313 n=1 Tax=Mytilus trossulus TaxID=6551 RepID=UPI003005434D